MRISRCSTTRSTKPALSSSQQYTDEAVRTVTAAGVQRTVRRTAGCRGVHQDDRDGPDVRRLWRVDLRRRRDDRRTMGAPGQGRLVNLRRMLAACRWLASIHMTTPSVSVSVQTPAAPHPRGYVAFRAGQSPHIDGRLDDSAWLAAPWTDTSSTSRATQDRGRASRRA